MGITDQFMEWKQAQFQPKHGTAERWNDCNCHDCRTNRVGRTLNPEEVIDASNDGVVITGEITRSLSVGTLCFCRSGEEWAADRPGDYVALSPASNEALDRVREYWRRRALAEMKAAEVARHLAAALAAAREHAMLFAKIADDGVLPVDRAQAFRATAAGMVVGIKEIERLHNSYKVHGDVPR